MLVNFEYPFLCGSFGLEIFHTCNKHIDGLIPNISWNFFFNPWKGVKVGSSKIALTATHVDRFRTHVGPLGVEITICYIQLG